MIHTKVARGNMRKGSYWDKLIYSLLLALSLASCDSGVDSSTKEGTENLEGATSSSMVSPAISSTTSSSSAVQSSSSGIFTSSSGYSSSSNVALGSSSSLEQSGSSSSSESISSSSSVQLSSSSSAAQGQIIINKQNCPYKAGTPYGTLACSEKTYKTVTITSASSSITLMAENLNVGVRIKGTGTGVNQHANFGLAPPHARDVFNVILQNY